MKTIVARRVCAGLGLLLVALWLAFIPLSASASGLSAKSRGSAPDFAVIDAYVLGQMRSLHIPGVALGIVHGNQVAHLRGFGVAGPSGAAVTPQTTFAISSMTKSFTAVAIMQLVEQGKMALDAPVQRYLPWFRVATPGASGQITVRELLNHTSGLSHATGNAVLTAPNGETMEQAVRALSAVELIAAPGTAFEYSNVNYVTLGLVVQVVSGQPYAAYIQQHIFAPLQMNHTFMLSSADTAVPSGMATGYRWWFGVPVPSSHHNPPADLPAGGIITSAADMTNFLSAQLNGGTYGNASILSPASIAVLHQPVVLPGSTAAQYAMGWYVVPVDGESILFHSGDDANFYSDMAVLPQSHWAIVVMRNVNSELGDLAQSSLLQAIPAGVIGLLLGHQPPAAALGLNALFLIVDAVLLVLTLLAGWSAFRLVRGWRRTFKRTPAGLLWGLGLPLLWEVALPIGLFLAIPQALGASWLLGLIFLPDVITWLLAMFILLLLTGLARVIRIVWLVRAPGPASHAVNPVPA